MQFDLNPLDPNIQQPSTTPNQISSCMLEAVLIVSFHVVSVLWANKTCTVEYMSSLGKNCQIMKMNWFGRDFSNVSVQLVFICNFVFHINIANAVLLYHDLVS